MRKMSSCSQNSTSLKFTQKIRVKNELGLHTRPATTIVKMLQNVKSNVWFSHKKDRVNAKSILSLLMLAVGRNGQVIIEVEGEDAEETMEKLVAEFENKFGEGS